VTSSPGRAEPTTPGRPAVAGDLDVAGDVVELTAALVGIGSVSGAEDVIATAVDRALRAVGHLRVSRTDNVVIARTDTGREQRVVLAAHLDTVPAAGNTAVRRSVGPDGPEIGGLGSVDMKGGLAVALHLAATMPDPARDITVICYDCEEVEAARNGLGRLAATDPDLLAGDLAILLEPTGGLVEAGCQGSLQLRVHTSGRRAHTARAWTGANAVHAMAPLLTRLAGYRPARPVVDGLEYREGLQAVAVEGGVASNVVPDRCTLRVNFRYAPDRTPAEALAHVRAVLAPGGGVAVDVEVVDDSPPARPGLDSAIARELVAALGSGVRAKYGWTDVSRFAALGIPAVNVGPGDPSRAHTPGEAVPEGQLRDVAAGLRRFLAVSPTRPR